ncbi:hypothetical protein ACWDTR_30375 [Streptomyces sp. NPDC003470]|uniref:hypothetical protein n=1 Tax=Streptomyces sp. NPDC059701 TaxID=3346914 RepID=UPI00369439AB
MRSARTLLATAAASAVVVLGAPGAYAAGGDWDHGDSSYSKEQDNGGRHDEPRGGMRTGGGALTAVNEGDWGGSGDSGEKSGGSGEKSWGGSGDSGEKSGGSGERDEPRGGMRTGGGALTAVNEGDWGGSGDSTEKSGGSGEKSWGGSGDSAEKSWGGSGDSGEKSWGGGEQEKPRGGMHTGGGGLSQQGATAGGLAVLGVAAAGLYAARRRKSALGAV